MSQVHSYDKFHDSIRPALKSKVEEFSILGFNTIDEEQLWSFLTKKKWRKVREDIKLYEIVEDIMSVKPGEYMNYASVEALKLTEFSFDNEEDMKELLK